MYSETKCILSLVIVIRDTSDQFMIINNSIFGSAEIIVINQKTVH